MEIAEEARTMSSSRDGFVGYVPTTRDMGPTFWIATLAVCLFCYCFLLPLLLALHAYYRTRSSLFDQEERSRRKNKNSHLQKNRKKKIQNDGITFSAMDSDDDSAYDDDEAEGDNAVQLEMEALKTRNSRLKRTLSRVMADFRQEEYSTAAASSKDPNNTSKSSNSNSSSTALTSFHPGTMYAHFDVEVHLAEAQPESFCNTVKSCCTTLLQAILDEGRPVRSRWQRCRESGQSKVFCKLLWENSNQQMAMDASDRDILVPMDEASEKDHLNGGIFSWVWDKQEARELIQLALIYASPPFVGGIIELLTLSVVGLWVGTNDLVAYLVVNRFVGFSMEVLYSGLLGSLIMHMRTLDEGTDSSDSFRKGQYTQITMILLVVSSLPLWVLWSLGIQPFLQWLGMNMETIEQGTNYTYLALVLGLVHSLSECVYYLLDCGEVTANNNNKGSYETLLILLEKALVVTLVAAWVNFEEVDLSIVGLIQVALAVSFFGFKVGAAAYNGRFQPCLTGLLASCALSDGSAPWSVCKTATPISLSSFACSGTWEALALLASFLGPAEVATWCLLAALWGVILDWFDGISFALGLRCEMFFKLQKPKHALQSAHMSVILVSLVSLLTAAIVFGTREHLAALFTLDTTIQELLGQLLVVSSMGIVTSAIGTMSWVLLRSQIQNRLATFVAWIFGWGIVWPISAILSAHFRMELQGQTAAMILGTAAMTIVNLYRYFAWSDCNKALMNKDVDSLTKPTMTVEDDDVGDMSPSVSTESTGAHAMNEDGACCSSSESDDGDSIANSSTSSKTSQISGTLVSSMVSSREVLSESTASQNLQPQSIATILPTSSRLIPTRRTMGDAPALGTHLERTNHSNRSSRTHSLADGMSSCSSVSKTILGYRDQDELGTLTDEELDELQDELEKILTALSATVKYDLDKSKKRVLEELQWVLYVSPDIFEIHHLETIIAFLHSDEDCRRELWAPIKSYLPGPLVLMGLERLLQNDYLVAAHLKALMDKYVLDLQSDGTIVEAEEGFERSLACQSSPQLSLAAFCFVLQE